MMLSKYLVVMYILVLLLNFIAGHDYFGFKYFIVGYDAGLFWMMLGMIILVLSILNSIFKCTWTGFEKRRRYKASPLHITHSANRSHTAQTEHTDNYKCVEWNHHRINFDNG